MRWKSIDGIVDGKPNWLLLQLCQFSREFLCSGYLELTAVRMPSEIKEVANFFQVFKGYCDREPIGVND